MSERKWVRSSLRHLQERLEGQVSHTTIGRLLRAMDYSLKVNVKRLTGDPHPDREQQFTYIESQKQAFLQAGWPVISVDSKKKELIGNFKNAGQHWCLEADPVNEHDFKQDALGKAVPYGLYNLNHHLGWVYVGQSADTPQFAVQVIAQWWQQPLSSPPVEAATARATGRLLGAGSDRMSLSHGCIEVEPGRTSFVWPDQRQLGWNSIAHLRDDAGAHPGYGQPKRPEGRGVPGGQGISKGPESRRRSHGELEYRTPFNLPQMELYHPAAFDCLGLHLISIVKVRSYIFTSPKKH